jgi:hypothetical protein
VTLGETLARQTGASWTSASWLGFTSTGCDADIDSMHVLRRGRYLL